MTQTSPSSAPTTTAPTSLGQPTAPARELEPTTAWIDPGSPETAALLERIHAIGPMLRENSLRGDEDRRLPEESAAALREIGAWRISTMARYGGFEAGARMLFEAARTIGYYCPSAGWSTVISNGSVMLANRFDDSALDRVFGPARGETVGMASVFASPQGTARPDGDGWRISGRWPFASNIHHSEWAIGILRVEDAVLSPSGIAFALLHREDYRIEDTWRTLGMRGTGSDTFVVEDRFVPADQLITFEQMMGTGFESDPEASFARRLTPHLTMATTIAGPSVGGTQAALDFVRSQAARRPVTFSSYAHQEDSGAFVHGIGQASAKIDTAVLLLQRTADAIDAAARGTEPMPLHVRARGRGGLGHSVHSVVDAMTDLIWLHGTASFAEQSPLGKLWRDVNTGARHATISAPVNYELHGDGLLGIDYISTKL